MADLPLVWKGWEILMIKLTQKATQYFVHVLNEIKKHSKEKPIKSKLLEIQFDLAGATVREIVHYLRVAYNEPIGSKNGYFYAKNMDELQHTINDLRSRVRKISDAEQGLCKAFPSTQQTSMFGSQPKKIKTNYDVE